MVRIVIYLQALWQNWWIIALTTIAAAGGALFLSHTSQPVYQTRLQLLVMPNMEAFEGRDLLYSLDALQKRSIVATYVEVIASDRIRRETFAALELADGQGADYSISAVALPEANVLEVSVAGPDPGLVTNMANTAAIQAIEFIGSTYDIYRLQMLDNAPVPHNPISPTPIKDTMLAVVIGLVLGGILAILRQELKEPVNQIVLQWAKLDPNSNAYKRSHFEGELSRLLSSESERLLIGLVRLGGLSRLELPAHVERDLLRRVVATIHDELPGRDLVGRWDEHSFAVVMRHIGSHEQARHKLDMLQQELSSPLEIYPGGDSVNLAPRLSAVIVQEHDTITSLAEKLTTTMVKAEKNGYQPLLYRQEIEARSRTEA